MTALSTFGASPTPKEEKLAAGVAVENAPGVALVNNHVIVRPHNWAEAKPYFTEADET